MDLNTECAMAPALRKAIAVRHGEQLVAQAAKAPRTTITLTFRVDNPWGHTPREVAAGLSEYAEEHGLLDAVVTIAPVSA